MIYAMLLCFDDCEQMSYYCLHCYLILLFHFVAMSLSCVVNTANCDANVLLCPVIKDELELILLLKPLIKKVLELILLAFVSSLIVFADMVGSIEVMVNPCAVILLRLLVMVIC